MNHLICTQKPWGVAAFHALRLETLGSSDGWTMLPDLGGLTTTKELLLAIETAAPRYVFFLNWSRAVPADIVRDYECVNFHCTPLPYGRGGHPIENMLLAGHADTTITAHRMTSEVDAGPIYGTKGPVSLAGVKDEILDRFVEPVAQLMAWIVAAKPVPAPQVGEAVRFKRLSESEYREFWATREPVNP